MSDKERYQIAKAYVDKQLKTMAENGLQIAKISDHEYDSMVKRIAQNVKLRTELKAHGVSSGSHT